MLEINEKEIINLYNKYKDNNKIEETDKDLFSNIHSNYSLYSKPESFKIDNLKYIPTGLCIVNIDFIYNEEKHKEIEKIHERKIRETENEEKRGIDAYIEPIENYSVFNPLNGTKDQFLFNFNNTSKSFSSLYEDIKERLLNKNEAYHIEAISKVYDIFVTLAAQYEVYEISDTNNKNLIRKEYRLLLKKFNLPVIEHLIKLEKEHNKNMQNETSIQFVLS